MEGVFDLLYRSQLTECIALCKQTGLCIDVGEIVWSHKYNEHIRNMKEEAATFGAKAKAILAKAGTGAALPPKYQCHPSDTKLATTTLMMF